MVLDGLVFVCWVFVGGLCLNLLTCFGFSFRVIGLFGLRVCCFCSTVDFVIWVDLIRLMFACVLSSVGALF